MGLPAEQTSTNYFLLPSNLVAERGPMTIQTVLGSCVAVCLFDKRGNFGGMNHYMLPYWSDQGLASPKYGNIAIEKLVQRMLALGSDRKHLVAKVFGGAAVLDLEKDAFEIGKRNIQVAETLLGEQGIPIVASNTGGLYGRKITMNTVDNTIMLKHLGKEKG